MQVPWYIVDRLYQYRAIIYAFLSLLYHNHYCRFTTWHTLIGLPVCENYNFKTVNFIGKVCFEDRLMENKWRQT